MEQVSIIGIDLAKRVFQLHAVSKDGETVLRKQLKRDQMLSFFVGFGDKSSIKVAMESSCGAHYWGRKLSEMGFQVVLLAAKFVKPFAVNQKNDKNDARAIAEAASRTKDRSVGIKSIEQLDFQSLIKARALIIKSRVQISNHIRGICLEYGVVISEGVEEFCNDFPLVLEDGSHELSTPTRDLMKSMFNTFLELRARECELDEKIKVYSSQSEDCQRLMKVPGVGPMTSLAFCAAVGTEDNFKNGRSVAANLGLIPRQYSSGGVVKLGRISKRTNSDLRNYMIQGARAVISASMQKKHPNPNQQRIKEKLKTKGWGRLIIAEANTMCRVMWHLHKNKEEYAV